MVYGRPAIAAGLPIGLEVELSDGDGPALVSDDAALAGDARPQRLVAEAAALAGIDPRRVVVARTLGAAAGARASAAPPRWRSPRCARSSTPPGRTLPSATALDWGRRLEAIFHGTSSGHRSGGGRARHLLPLRARRAAERDAGAAGRDRCRSSSRSATASAQHRRGGRRPARALGSRPRAPRSALRRGRRGRSSGAQRRSSAGDLAALGRAFDDNQALLETLGVSSEEIAALVAAARRAGALGAKLTGGGAGGAVIALSAAPEDLAARLEREGWRTVVTRIAGRSAPG